MPKPPREVPPLVVELLEELDELEELGAPNAFDERLDVDVTEVCFGCDTVIGLLNGCGVQKPP